MKEIYKNIDKKISINGNTVAYRSLPSYFKEMHDHDAVQILIPLEGTDGQIQWANEDKDFQTKILSIGDICLIPPLLEHEIQWLRSANFVNFYIRPKYLQQNIDETFDIESKILKVHIGLEDQFLFQIGLAIKNYFQYTNQENNKYFDAILTVVSQHLICNYVLNDDQKVLFNDYEQLPCEKIRKAVRYLTLHLSRNISVEEVADEVEMSHYHFIHVFKEMVGMPPSKFHMMQRLEKAKELLKSNKAIIDVAYELGFSSQSHFSNVFAKSFGITPKKFMSQ